MSGAPSPPSDRSTAEAELERRRAEFDADPDDVVRRHALVAALIAAGATGEALSLLDEAAGDPQERFQVAAALSRIDRTRRAETILREILSEEPLHADAQRLLGRILLGRGRALEALVELERLRRFAAHDAEGRVLLARARHALGWTELARQSLEEALQIDPYLEEAHEASALLCEELGEWERALEAWGIARELASTPERESERDERIADCARRVAAAGRGTEG